MKRSFNLSTLIISALAIGGASLLPLVTSRDQGDMNPETFTVPLEDAPVQMENPPKPEPTSTSRAAGSTVRVLSYREYQPKPSSETLRRKGLDWFGQGMRAANDGNLKLRKHALELAVAHFSQAVAVDSGNREAKYNLAVTYRELGTRSQPISKLLLESMAPQSTTKYKNLESESRRQNGLKNYSEALSKIKSGDFQGRTIFLVRAISAFKSATTIDPKDPEPYYNLAICYLELGDREQAYSCLERSISLSRVAPQHFKVSALNLLKLENQRK